MWHSQKNKQKQRHTKPELTQSHSFLWLSNIPHTKSKIKMKETHSVYSCVLSHEARGLIWAFSTPTPCSQPHQILLLGEASGGPQTLLIIIMLLNPGLYFIIPSDSNSCSEHRVAKVFPAWEQWSYLRRKPSVIWSLLSGPKQYGLWRTHQPSLQQGEQTVVGPQSETPPACFLVFSPSQEASWANWLCHTSWDLPGITRR